MASVIGVRGERDRHAGADLEPLGRLRREQQREERIVAGLGGHAAVVAVGLQLAGLVADRVEPAPEDPVHLHARAPLSPLAPGRYPLPCHTPAVPSDR